MGFNKRYISLDRVLNVYSITGDPVDVIHYVTSVDALLMVDSDTLLKDIVEASINKEPQLVKKLIDNYIYNK